MAPSAADNMEKLQELGGRIYKEQACYFLNAFWKSLGESSTEEVWKLTKSMESLDEKYGEKGNELDELSAHKFLEINEETMTVRELREVLRSIDIDTNTMVSLAEYLIFRYKVDWGELVNSIQGDSNEVEKAQALLSAAQSRVAELQKREAESKLYEAGALAALKTAHAALEVATEAENVAKSAENEAKNAETEAKIAEAEAKAAEHAYREAERCSLNAKARAENAENEVREAQERVKKATDEVVAAKLNVDAAASELQAEQEAFKDRLDSLEAVGNDEYLGGVARNKAKHERAQALTEDPLPLQRAKLRAEAEQRKHERLTKEAFLEREKAEAAVKLAEEATNKATKAAQEATRAADIASKQARESEAARAEAEARREEAEKRRKEAELRRQESELRKQESMKAKHKAVKARKAAEVALEEAKAAFAEAEAFLEKASKTMPQGTLWWMERELEEARFYWPESKGGKARK